MTIKLLLLLMILIKSEAHSLLCCLWRISIAGIISSIDLFDPMLESIQPQWATLLSSFDWKG